MHGVLGQARLLVHPGSRPSRRHHRSVANQLNPGVYRGYEGFLRWVNEVEEIWDQFIVVPEEFIDGGEHVFVGIRMSGQGKGSGVDVDMRVFNVWTFRDGKVWRVTGGYRDRNEALEAAGLRE